MRNAKSGSKSSAKKKERPVVRPSAAHLRAPVPAPPKLPEMERAFFEILLGELDRGLQESEKELRRLDKRGELLRGSNRLRGTVSYARALLRLEAFHLTQRPAQAEQAEVAALLNVALNTMRRSFLYAGVAVRRSDQEPAFAVRAPGELALFLLEEMLACCLRCAPEGRNLYIGTRPIGGLLLLSMRTEGPALQQSPLIPLLYHPSESADSSGGPIREEDEEEAEAPAREEDYGFAMCRVIAAQLGWAFRWEADEAGVRMFVDMG